MHDSRCYPHVAAFVYILISQDFWIEPRAALGSIFHSRSSKWQLGSAIPPATLTCFRSPHDVIHSGYGRRNDPYSAVVFSVYPVYPKLLQRNYRRRLLRASCVWGAWECLRCVWGAWEFWVCFLLLGR